MLFVHGIRAVGNVENSAIAGSGAAQFPDAPPVRRETTSYPHLTGHYVSLDAHPRVFDTREDLQDIARRAGKQGTYSSGRYAALADRVRRDLSAKVDWQATYSGCDLEIYLRGFAYEQKPAYGNDRSDDRGFYANICIASGIAGQPASARSLSEPGGSLHSGVPIKD